MTFLTTLPASTMIAVCLFLPHTQTCRGTVETPFESGTWIVIAPILIVGLLPVAWRALPSIRRETPELVLTFTMIVMALFVVTIPIAIWLMWGYSKRTLRGEVLVAMSSSALVMMWLFCYPLTWLFDTALPAAVLTWGAGGVLLVGLVVWTSAAATRPDENAREAGSLHASRVPLGLQLHV